MDHPRSLRPVEDHKFEQVPGPVRSKHQISDWIVGNLLDHPRMFDYVLHVLIADAVSAARREDLHMRNVLRNLHSVESVQE
ncbi:hypothetical protein BH20ACT21_BH20ACT21_16550 [soil metagenome]